MNESISRTSRRWRISLRTLMVLPVVCAPFFVWIATAERVPKLTSWEREYRWTSHPLKEFSPKQGESVSRSEDEFFKVSKIFGTFGGRPYGRSFWLTWDGKLRDAWHTESDAGGGEIPAPPQFLAELPAMLESLPPSNPLVKPENRVYVAFPVQGVWEVRVYPEDDLPKVVKNLIAAISVRGL